MVFITPRIAEGARTEGAGVVDAGIDLASCA
jgi:hypothetical protein